ncbi:MAG TPA: MarR family winged helix-turn-helix transcriptional regulator [Solirubrobacteraceae bacterium]|nr:MarR family winged helix-turn-helix transcriptional regulator [Solirubrobacteraceae bacterium]
MSTIDATSAVPVHATVLIARLARAVRKRFELTLTPLGLRQRHVVALSFLRGHGPTAQQMLADQLCMDASSTVCLLNELEDHDLVVRQRDRSDRRRALIELSSQGERALCEVDRALQSVEDEILAGLDADERAMLRGLLARLKLADPELPADE